MHDESRKGMVWWVVAGLLVLTMIVAAVIGFVNVEHWKRSTIWDVKAGEISIESVDYQSEEEEGKYYKLRFELTNNSSRNIESRSYQYDVYEKGNEGHYGVNIISPEWEEEVAINSKGCIPSGCTGTVELFIAIKPDSLESSTLEVKLDPYGKMSKVLGTVEIPE